MRRFLFTVTSSVLTLALVGAGVCFVAFGTETGQDLLRRQTEAVVARVLGSDFTAVLGNQSVALTADGSLAIRWSDVSLMRQGAAMPTSEVDKIEVGLAILPLLTGKLVFDSVEIAGAEIDLTQGNQNKQSEPTPIDAANAATPPPATLPQQAERLLSGLERQFGSLHRIGLRTVTLSNVSLIAPIGAEGGPFVAGVETATLSLGDSRALSMSAVLKIDGTPIPISGQADYDPETERLGALNAVVGPVDLGGLFPPGSPEDRLDTRPFATDAAGTLAFDLTSSTPEEGRIASLSVDLGPGALQAGRGHTTVENAHVGLSYVEGEDAIELVDTALRFDGFQTGLDGRAVARYRPDGGFDGFDFALQSHDMRSTIGTPGEEPLEASLVVEGHSATADREVRLTKLVLATGEGHLGGSAVLAYGAPDDMTTLRLEATNLAASNVKAFWPFNISVSTRRWALEHVRDAGFVTGGVIALDVRQDRRDAAFKPGNHPNPDELDVALDLDGATVQTLGRIPELVGAKGSVQVTGGDTRVLVDEAGVAGLPSVKLSQSTVDFIRAPEAAPQDLDGMVALKLSGDLPELLEIAAHEPINALRTLDFKPQDTTGRASVEAALSFRLGDDVPKNEQVGTWSVDADLANAALKVPIEGRRISGVTGPIHVMAGGASGEISGTVDDIPAKIVFNRPFGSNPMGERKLDLALSLDGGEVARLAPALSEIVDGPVEAVVSQAADSSLSAKVALTGNALTLPWIGWRKGKGVPASLAFDIVTGKDGTDLKNLKLEGDGFSASGEVETDADGLRSALLGKVALNPGDDVGVKVQRVANGYSISVDGQRFDARPFLNDLKASLGEKAKQTLPKSRRQIDVGVAVGALTGFGNEELSNFSLNYAGSGGDVSALSIAGATRGGPFTADMSPRGKQRAIQIRTGDAGRLADFSGLYGRMEGGAVSLDLLGSSDDGYRGVLKAENFTLVDEPRLSSLVGSQPTPGTSSLSQAVGAEMRTERAFFDHASAGIAYGSGGLSVTDGIIRGPVFGSSFSGTVYDSRNRIDIVGSFMPAYGINRIFGAIPVLGQILGNGNEGGLIGITYRLDGAFASPTLTVNPISAIAPGIFRNIFAYQ